MENDLNQLAIELFTTFVRFEYALKAAGLTTKQVPPNGEMRRNDASNTRCSNARRKTALVPFSYVQNPERNAPIEQYRERYPGIFATGFPASDSLTSSPRNWLNGTMFCSTLACSSAAM